MTKKTKKNNNTKKRVLNIPLNLSHTQKKVKIIHTDDQQLITKVNQNRFDFEDSKVIKLLGQGGFGKVYKIKLNDKIYALKIEKLLSRDSFYLQNEIRLMNTIGFKHKDQFSLLYNYRVINNCRNNKFINRNFSIINRKNIKNNLCLVKLYSFVQQDLEHFSLNNLKLHELYSITIQILYIVYLIHNNGFIHGDLYPKNIGINLVEKDKTTRIFNYNLPLFGYQINAIDYGSLLHKDKLSNREEFKFTHDIKDFYERHKLKEQTIIYTLMSNMTSFWNYVDKHKIRVKSYEDSKHLILAQPEIEELKKYTTNDFILYKLYKLFNEEKFEKLIFGNHYKEYIPINNLIPTEDLKYVLINYNNSKLLIEYFIKKLQHLIGNT